jgi:hypothetical protein
VNRVKKVFIVATIALVLFFSCVTENWVSPTVTGGFDNQVCNVCVNVADECLSDVSDAVQTWDKSLKNWKRFVVNSGSYCCINISETDLTEKYENTNVLAYTPSLGSREIFLIRGRYERAVQLIVLHEMGHALGAQHVPGTLMASHLNTISRLCPDATTVAQVAAWNKIDIESLSWCW